MFCRYNRAVIEKTRFQVESVMSRQAYFFMHPEDLVEFDEHIRLANGVVFVPCRLKTAVVTPQKSAVCDTPLLESSSDNLTLYMCRPDDLHQLHPHERPVLGDWTVNPRKAPVVEFWRSYFDGRVLKRGRLSFELDGQSRDFNRFADSLLRHIRRKYTRSDFGAYAGDHALSMA